MAIKGSGNVGIGTDSPDSILEISKAQATGPILKITEPTTLNGTVEGGPGNNLGVLGFVSADTSTSQAGLIRASIEAEPGEKAYGTGGLLTFNTMQTYSGTGTLTDLIERMRIDSSGNVGINVGPSTQLHNLQKTNDRAGGFYTQLGGNSYGLSMFVNSGGYGIIGSNGSFTTDIITMDLNSGNVGIGAASPDFALDIEGLDSGVQLQMGRTNSSAGSTWMGSDSNGFHLGVGAYGSGNSVAAPNGFTVNTSGNVGIGENGPDNKFVVRGSGSGFNSTLHPSVASIVSNEMSDNAYHSILQLVAVRQSLVTGNASNGYLGFSTMDDSNNQGQLDAGRIAIVNESGSSRNSATALSFWTNPGGTQTTAAVEKMRITSSGRILIPGLDGKTQVHPDVSYRTSDGELFYQTSSERYKTDIVDLENCLDKVNSLRTVRFTDVNTNEPGFGLIAEETNEIIPEVVFSKNEQIEGISYSNLTPFLIKAIQELKADNDSLKARIETLENN